MPVPQWCLKQDTISSARHILDPVNHLMPSKNACHCPTRPLGRTCDQLKARFWVLRLYMDSMSALDMSPHWYVLGAGRGRMKMITIRFRWLSFKARHLRQNPPVARQKMCYGTFPLPSLSAFDCFGSHARLFVMRLNYVVEECIIHHHWQVQQTSMQLTYMLLRDSLLLTY